MAERIISRPHGASTTVGATPESAALDFERGRDIAISMLEEAEGLGDEGEGLRRYRDGNAQRNVAKGYLVDVCKEPALIDGFTAVLSVVLQHGPVGSRELRRISLAETQAGEAGADGTEPCEADEAEDA